MADEVDRMLDEALDEAFDEYFEDTYNDIVEGRKKGEETCIYRAKPCRGPQSSLE